MKFNKGSPYNTVDNWHKVFVWWPVTIQYYRSSIEKEQVVWLEKVWRKRIYEYPRWSSRFTYIYSDIDPESL